MPEEPSEITITYSFRLPGGEEVVLAPRLRTDTLELVREPPRVLPDWAALTFRQCTNCPLSPARNPLCPVAEVLCIRPCRTLCTPSWVFTWPPARVLTWPRSARC